MKSSTLTVLGAGYVGLTTAALLANAGYTVYLVEPNRERLSVISKGKSFFFEQGLDDVISTALQKGTLIPTDSYAKSISNSNIIFSCVGTPDNPDGSSDLTYVFNAAQQTLPHIQPDTIYVQKSTVPVGTGAQLEALFTDAGKNMTYVSNPEFLCEGTAISDALYFDRIVAGGGDGDSVAKILDIYRQLESYRDTIAAIAHVMPKEIVGSYIATNLNSAELIKVTSNAFLALKISFANSIAKLSDQAGADITEVMEAVGADRRIGRSFLNAGRGYGGGCFPKDVSGLIMSGLEYGVDLEILSAAQALNASMPGYIVEKTRDAFGGVLTNKNVAVLGLAFKANTSDIRRSPGILIANILSKAGANVTVYDPVASGEATTELRPGIVFAASFEQAITGVDAIIIATAWPKFINYELGKYQQYMNGDIVVDAVNGLKPKQVITVGLRYIGVGRSESSLI